MNPELVVGGFILTIVTHIAISSYYYGRLTRLVEINTKRLDHVEIIVEHHEKRLSTIEGVCRTRGREGCGVD